MPIVALFGLAFGLTWKTSLPPYSPLSQLRRFGFYPLNSSLPFRRDLHRACGVRPISPRPYFLNQKHVLCAARTSYDLVHFELESLRVAILGILDKKNHQNVTIVVPVLITSCQVSLKAKIGPVTAQAKTRLAANRKAAGLATTLEVPVANRLK